eukprot:TRINITY_DN3627_c0_g1_i1.p1 TRINITY_DN3627_c0_g1~~TRINITY_DN3627_c0_g1_i1.p1  ORF type:complete len:387 (-),score=80.21 TRINITY_DN3627_c0_g1_i1:49-1209(-)
MGKQYKKRYNSMLRRLRKNTPKRKTIYRDHHFWLRAETKLGEERIVMHPQHVQKLIDNGHTVTVEKSSVGCVRWDAFQSTGCDFADAGSWVNAPNDAIITALKELPEEDTFPLKHRHIMFAHVFKGQTGAKQFLQRLKEGGGTLYDLEFLADERGRVAHFGHAAGEVGCAFGLLNAVLVHQNKNKLMPAITQTWETFDDLAAHVRSKIDDVGYMPSLFVMGALGRVGKGSISMAERIGIEDIAKWDMAETKEPGPYKEINNYDVYANCIYLQPGSSATFLTLDSLKDPQRKLSSISDISCDPNNPSNPIPIYDALTSYKQPTRRIIDDPERPLDVFAIDNLPSRVPGESSSVYADTLLPHILQFGETSVWTDAEAIFRKHLEKNTN